MKKRTLLFTLLSILILSFIGYLFLPIQNKSAKSQNAGSLSNYCPFCDPKVVNLQKFYEDEFAIALYSYKPIYPGHCLIIPKRHKAHFDELSNEEFSHIAAAIKKTHQAVSKIFNTEPYLLLQKNGKEAGQTVFHVHFHYIPKKLGDQSFAKFLAKMYLANKKAPLSPEELKKIVEQLRKEIASNSDEPG